MSFEAPDSLAERIARYIEQQIITGNLAAGDRIQELRIAKELDVSRGSVREAYLILERSYLIEIIPRKGALVAAMTPAQVAQLYDMNILLLSWLIRQATEKWQQQDLAPFQTLIATMETQVASQQYLDFLETTFEFTRLGYRFTDNQYLQDMLDQLRPATRRAYYQAISQHEEEMQHSLQFFQALMARILERDTSAAVMALELFAKHQCSTVLRSL